ncbi:MAG: hypothetical protein Unbinned1322contig1000_28 [Prokaryotic dsDNA virus sp.]|nr:hypothetical protein [Aequorivita sp.]QDP57284.1 MAG: hypothetical protein Unbinned1322contig1000_28 [Prokaryotic dsDNA virus sp.]
MVRIAIFTHKYNQAEWIKRDYKEKGFKVTGNIITNGELTYVLIPENRRDEMLRGTIWDDITGSISGDELYRLKSIVGEKL